jgi:hypothetical protein
MPPPRICDIEELIEIYPNAVIFLFRFLVGGLTVQLKQLPKIGTRTLLILATYLAGMVVLQRKRTQTRIANQFDHVSHDQLWRLARLLKPIRALLLSLSIELVQLITGCPGWYILDDVLIEKPYARWMIGLYDQYDHTTKRHVKGIRIVVVLWTNGLVRVPVAFSLWHAKGFAPRYRTKNQIARLLIYKINKLTPTLSTSYLVCDNWYASKQNLCFFESLAIEVVTRLRKNAWVTIDENPIQLKNLAQRDPISTYHYYRELSAYVRSYVVTYPKVGPVKVAVIKNDRHAEAGKTKFLICRQLGISNTQLVMRYRNRWIIEEFFRDCKQHFGVADGQARELDGLIFHLQMVFSTAVFCDLLRDELTATETQTVGEVLSQLREIKLLKIGEAVSQPIALRSDGKIESLDWETFLNPARTKLSVEIGAEVPESVYDFTLLRK